MLSRWALLAACLALALTAAPRPSAALYHSSAQILHWFTKAAHSNPQRIRCKSLSDHTHPTKLFHAAITNYSSSGGALDARKQVVFVFGEHAREVITSEVALWFGRLLTHDAHARPAEWPELHAALARVLAAPREGWTQYVHRTVDALLSRCIVQLVPIEATAARRMWERGALCQRKTQTQVDLNRNWPFAWQESVATDEQYGGPRPLSEPEARLLKQLLRQRPTLGYLNVHSGEWAMYTPWDSKPGYGPGLPADMPQLVDTIGKLCDCKAGPAGTVSGYLAYGSSMDYAYVEEKVRYPITIEVYGGGDVGKLAAGEKNTPLTDWPLLDSQGREIAPQQPQQHEHQPRRALLGRRGERGLLQGGDSHHQQQQQQQTLQEPSWVASSAHQQLGHQPQPAGWGAPALRQAPTSQASSARPADAGAALGAQRVLQQRQQQLGSSHSSSDPLLDMVAKATAAQYACFAAYNPLDATTYRRVVAEWLAVFLVTLQHMLDHQP